MLIYIFKILFIWSLFISNSLSESFDSVLIEGNSRISNETIKVFSVIPTEKDISENDLNKILKNLYSTGFFEDVQVNIIDKKLVIKVIENPIIQTVFIEGIKSKKNTSLIKDSLILKDRSSFNSSDVKKDQIITLNVLKNLGYYFAKLETVIRELDQNKSDLIYSIDLGKKAKIKKISFVGEKIFKDSLLKSIIVTEEFKFWKFISGKKYLNENLINFDKRLLKNYYKNNGYYNVIIESSFANYLGNDEFELIFNINSNEKHYFNNMEINLPDDYDINNFDGLAKLFKKLKGEPYSLNSVNDILNEIDKITLDRQYEFLSSTVNEVANNNLINFKFNIAESEKLYIEKINILGNNITREDVIRNHLQIDEGDAFNDILHTKSINNIKSLNFFSNVESNILEGSSQNEKIIDILVEEKPTGEIAAGAGVSTTGTTFSFGVKENNYLGRGVKFDSNLSVSKSKIKGLLSLENPNYKGSDKSLSFVLESTSTDRLTTFGYKSNKTGISLATGFEYFDDLYLNAGLSSYIEDIKVDSSATNSVKKNKGSYFDTYANYTFDYDKRNQKFQTSSGYRSVFTQGVPLLSDNYTLKNTYNFKNYNKWSNESITTLGFFMSSANSITGNDVKLSDRIYIPSSKLRGFETGKVGPMDGSDYVGGNYSVAFNVATTIPQLFPNSENTNFSVFFDAANVWGIDYSSNLKENDKIKSAVGIAVDFFTPIGPLNFSVSEVLTKDKNDVAESFRFNLGTTF